MARNKCLRSAFQAYHGGKEVLLPQASILFPTSAPAGVAFLFSSGPSIVAKFLAVGQRIYFFHNRRQPTTLQSTLQICSLNAYVCLCCAEKNIH